MVRQVLPQTAADFLREQGWGPGDILDGAPTDREAGHSIVITAIGEDAVLGRRVEPYPTREHTLIFDYREWSKRAEPS